MSGRHQTFRVKASAPGWFAQLHNAGARSVGFVYILSLTARLWAFPALASIALSGAVGEDGRDAR